MEVYHWLGITVLDYRPKLLSQVYSYPTAYCLCSSVGWPTWWFRKMTVSPMLKGFSICQTWSYSLCDENRSTILLTALLIGVGRSLEQENKELAYQQQCGKPRQLPDLETFKLNDNLWQEELVGLWEIHRLFLSPIRWFAECRRAMWEAVFL